ncbi:MAG: GNAT family N-acetyltransferase [Chloroflexota bacterium]
MSPIQNQTIRAATPDDQSKLTRLIHDDVYNHSHSGWRSPLDWLGHQPFLIMEKNDQAVAALACPPDPANIHWIRLFTCSTKLSLLPTWEQLWGAAWEQCRHKGVALSMCTGPWFVRLLKHSHFRHINNVLMLSWKWRSLPPQRTVPGLEIRPMQKSDLASVLAVDVASFDPIWQISMATLQLALYNSLVATVAVQDNRIVAYQITSPAPFSGHLSRLATHPDAQRQGIGLNLVSALLAELSNQGTIRLTVNTQQNNLASLALYKKVGFQPTGDVYPVYAYP